MRAFREIKHDYRFREEDAKRLAGLLPLMEEHAEEVMRGLRERGYHVEPS